MLGAVDRGHPGEGEPLTNINHTAECVRTRYAVQEFLSLSLCIPKIPFLLEISRSAFLKCEEPTSTPRLVSPETCRDTVHLLAPEGLPELDPGLGGEGEGREKWEEESSEVSDQIRQAASARYEGNGIVELSSRMRADRQTPLVVHDPAPKSACLA